MTWTLLFAQIHCIAQAPTPTNGNEWSGWSAVAVLMFVLSWVLFKHIPDTNTAAATKDEEHRKQIDALNLANQKFLGEVLAGHKAETKESNERSEKRQDLQQSAFNLHAREARDDGKDKLLMTLKHCEDESKNRAIEMSNISALLHKDLDTLQQSQVALGRAIELLAQSTPSAKMLEKKERG